MLAGIDLRKLSPRDLLAVILGMLEQHSGHEKEVIEAREKVMAIIASVPEEARVARELAARGESPDEIHALPELQEESMGVIP